MSRFVLLLQLYNSDHHHLGIVVVMRELTILLTGCCWLLFNQIEEHGIQQWNFQFGVLKKIPPN